MGMRRHRREFVMYRDLGAATHVLVGFGRACPIRSCVLEYHLPFLDTSVSQCLHQESLCVEKVPIHRHSTLR